MGCSSSSDFVDADRYLFHDDRRIGLGGRSIESKDGIVRMLLVTGCYESSLAGVPTSHLGIIAAPRGVTDHRLVHNVPVVVWFLDIVGGGRRGQSN